MNQCWSEGELRAYLDGELPSRDMDRVSAHIRECAACGGLCGDLAARADQIRAWMEILPDAPAPVRVPPAPRRVPASRRWATAAIALAASLLLGVVLLPKRGGEIVTAPRVVVPKSQAPAAPPVKPAIIRRETPRRATPAKPKPQIQYYVSLDNEPIETGLVVRVGLGGGQVPADVIVGPDGRARAILLVNENSGELK